MNDLTFPEMNRLFYRAIMEVLGYDPDETYGAKAPPVRQTNTVPGSPDWKLGDDVVFFGLRAVSGDPISQPVDETWQDAEEDLLRIHRAIRVVELSLTAYGPNACDRLTAIRHKFLDGSKILRAEKFYIIPSADVPEYAPEVWQGEWWSRANLALRFDQTLEWREEIKTIETVPVTIKSNRQGASTETDEETITKKG